MSKYLYNPPLQPQDSAGDALAWYCEYVRCLLLLETLAEDMFPDQATFDAWIARQDRLVRGAR